jgi:hypothetical protein
VVRQGRRTGADFDSQKRRLAPVETKSTATPSIRIAGWFLSNRESQSPLRDRRPAALALTIRGHHLAEISGVGG